MEDVSERGEDAETVTTDLPDEAHHPLQGLDADQAAALQRLLTGAVAVAASFVDVESPREIHQRLIDGLVERMGIAAAVLWRPREGDLALVTAAGLPRQTRDRVATLGLDPEVLAVSRGERSQLRTDERWVERTLHLVSVGSDDGAILGVYVREAPPLLLHLLGELARAATAAATQTARHRRTSSVLAKLQAELQPDPVELAAFEGFEVGSIYESAAEGVEVGGDFADVFVVGSGALGFTCGDVSGKGIEAANITAMTVHSLRAFALHGASASTVVQMLNQTLCRRTSPERFVTLGYGVLDPTTGEVRFTLAGHPPPIVLGADGSPQVLEVEADVPVGLYEGADYALREFVLEPGQHLILYTDGVTEARRAGSDAPELLGEDGLLKILSGCGDMSAQELASCIWSEVREWSGGRMTDDCAIVVVRRTVREP